MALACQRAAFDLPSQITYLNCAYMGPLSRRVLEAGREGLERKAQPWDISQEDFFTTADRVRERFARLVGGDAKGVALLPSVSYGTATAARNIDIRPGQNIVLLAEQFPSNVYVWRDLAERSAASIVTVPCPGDSEWTASIVSAITPATAVVAVPICHWTDGTLIDLETVGKRIHEVGGVFLIDGSQSIGAVPFDVSRLRPDFVIAPTYKWLLGPYSQAMMWVSPRYRSGRPLELNWITRSNSRDFSTLANYTDELNPGAGRYDVGEVSNFGLLPASLACLEQTLDWGVETIQTNLDPLIRRIANGAEVLDLGVPKSATRSPHMIGLRLKGRDPRPLVDQLRSAQVYVSVRGDSIRVSPHVYNNEDDIDRLLELLEQFVRSASSTSKSSPTEESRP